MVYSDAYQKFNIMIIEYDWYTYMTLDIQFFVRSSIYIGHKHNNSDPTAQPHAFIDDIYTQ